MTAPESGALHAEVTQQLRLLADLRDLLERWLDLARPGQRHVDQVQHLLLDIQKARNALLEVSMTTAHVVIGEQVRSSQILLGTALDVLRMIGNPLSPLNNLMREFLRRSAAECGERG